MNVTGGFSQATDNNFGKQIGELPMTPKSIIPQQKGSQLQDLAKSV